MTRAPDAEPATDPHDPLLAPGRTVARWRLVRRIGAGATGTIWQAEETSTAERVALKVLRLTLADDARDVARFEREAKVLASIRHDNIVAVRASGRMPDGRPYLVLPLLDGHTLADEMRAHAGPFEARRAWPLARAIATALQAAHENGIVHRDLKPDNVFIVGESSRRAAGLDEASRVRVLDFGLARPPLTSPSEKLTETGSVVGTPAYMAPEQWWNEGVGAAADQYALGVMLFELLAGRLPFADAQYVALMQAHLSSPPPTLASAGITSPPAVEAFLSRSLAKKPSDRYESMDAWIAAGDRAFGVPVAQVRSRRIEAAFALACGLGAMIAVGYTGSRSPMYVVHIAGIQAYVILVAAFAIGAFTWILGRSPGTAWLALPGVLGAVGTYSGWRVVREHLGSLDPARHFQVFNDGVSEANANRFLGLGIAGALLIMGTALEGGTTRRDPRDRRESTVAAAGLTVFALAGALIGAPSATWVAGAGALALALGTARAHSLHDAIRLEAARVAGVATIGAAALCRVDARAAAAWAAQPTRAQRAAEIAGTAWERTGTWVAIAAVTVALIAVGTARVRRAPRLPGARMRTRHLAVAGFFVVWGIADVVQSLAIARDRDGLSRALAPQFETFGQIDPPSADGLPAPRLAPTLQIGREVIAIDAVAIARTATVGSPASTTTLTTDLSHRFAREPDFERASVQLSVACDRHVEWGVARRLLQLARQLGAERIEILTTRGTSPRFARDMPPEARFAIPRDFGALRIDVSTRAGETFADGASFADVVARLAADAIERRRPSDGHASTRMVDVRDP